MPCWQPWRASLATLGLTETRAFDARYAPEEIRVEGTSPVLDWSYTTDLVGNITGITDDLNAANNRTYTYQDIHYFLTQGNGPWGPRNWTYDKIGNRLTETRGAVTDTYTYPTNATGGRNPKLQSIAPPTGEPRRFGYDEAGNNNLIYDRNTQLDLLYDSASRLAVLRSTSEDARTNLLYDGRGFLRQASAGVDECRPGVTIPTYDSEGLLHCRSHRALFTPAAPPLDTDTVFYLAGRPVATLRLTPSTSTLTYLTTDHLGTPILATADTGALIWQGGFEPFGENWNGASGAGVFLRFPGQWVDQIWEGGRLESGLYYNVHRWYGISAGRYIEPDPLQLGGSDPNLYLYASANPIQFLDRLGLASTTLAPPPSPPVPPQTLPPPQQVPPVCPAPGPVPKPRVIPKPRLPWWGAVGTLILEVLFNPPPADAPTLEQVYPELFPPNCGEDCKEDPAEIRRLCTRLFIQCYENLGRHILKPGWRCEDCMRHCMAQDGEWPFRNCNLWAR